MIAKETSSHSVKLDIEKTDNKPFNRNRRSTPTITYAEAQLIVKHVITHLNTGRGRAWSKLTAA